MKNPETSQAIPQVVTQAVEYFCAQNQKGEQVDGVPINSYFAYLLELLIESTYLGTREERQVAVRENIFVWIAQTLQVMNHQRNFAERIYTTQLVEWVQQAPAVLVERTLRKKRKWLDQALIDVSQCGVITYENEQKIRQSVDLLVDPPESELSIKRIRKA